MLALACCALAGALWAQAVPPAAGPVPAAGQPAAAVQPAAAQQVEPFWTAEQKKTYTEVKAVLDRGEVPISPQRRALDDVCDHLASELAKPEQGGTWGDIRSLLIAADSYAISPVLKHELVASATEQARLQGIIVLVSVKDAIQPKDGIVKALKDPSAAVRLWAIRGAASKQYAEAGDAVAALALDESPEVSLAATKAVAALKVPKAEGYLVALVARELTRRAPLTQQLTDLQAQRKALVDKPGRTPEEDQQVTALGQRIDEFSGRVSLSNLLIYQVGDALSTLTNNVDGSELKSAMSDVDLQKVVDGLQQKYPLPVAH